ncbi:MAG: FG-GAP-like repeat-containing protein [Luteibaculaceae bacterium]
MSPIHSLKINAFWVFIGIIAMPLHSWGQLFPGFQSAQDIPVIIDNEPLKMPWSGGLISPQFSLLDVNFDGIKDLVAFDRSADRVMVFLVEPQENGAIQYTYTDVYNGNFPPMANWMLLRDYNCDGIEDIFTQTTGGIRVFKNTSQNGVLSFQMSYAQLNTFVNFGGTNQFSQNLYVERVDIPIIEDFDGNGKLDIIAYGLAGTRAEYHKNTSTDCEVLSFHLRNLCFGYFKESEMDNTLTLGSPCSFNVINPGLSSPPSELIHQYRNEQVTRGDGVERHVGTTLSAFDLNNDGKKEVFIGDIEFFGINALFNSISTSGRDSMISQVTNWPTNTAAINIPNFPATYFIDVDNDGITDLIASPNDRNASKNKDAIWHYKNTGTNTNPVFEFQTEKFLQGDMLDIGEDAKPYFFDYNDDGLMDLVVAGRGIFVEEFAYLSTLWLFENTGTATQPEFTLISNDWLGLSNLNLQNLTPAFGDLNNNGNQDMILTDLFGNFSVYLNNPDAEGIANFSLSTPNLVDANGAPVTGGLYSLPTLFDLDGDGLLDLLIGNRTGRIRYYRNTGSSTLPQFTLITTTLGGVDVREPTNIAGTCAPFFFKNEDGETQLIAGSESGRIFYFNNIDNNLTGNFTEVSSNWFNLKDGTRCFPYLLDIDNNGHLDLFLGLRGGGIKYFRGGITLSANQPSEQRLNLALKLYPNPIKSSQLLNIELPKNWQNIPLQISLLSIDGQNVFEQRVSSGSGVVNMQLPNLASGLYLVRILDPNGGVASSKLLIQ